MKKWLKRIFWVVVLAGIVVAAVFSFRPQPVEIDVCEVVSGNLEVTVDEDGKTRIKEKYIVSTPVGGRLQRINLREGDLLQCNQSVLAEIEPGNPDLLDARATAQAQARVAAAQAAVERADSRKKRLEIEKDQALREFNRAEQLIDSNAIADSDFEQAEANLRAANESFRSAEFDEDIANYELQLAEAALIHVAPDRNDESMSENFTIKSPIDGVVLRLLQESSTIVTPGTPIMELGDHHDLEVVVDVLSTDAVKIRPGTRVYLERWGGDRVLDGVVRLIEPAAFEKISALGVEEQRVNIIIDLDPTQSQIESMRLLGDGYRIEARMVVWSGESVIKIPTSALFREDNQWSVFAVDGETVNLVPVTIGQRNDLEAEIISGLRQGDIVVLHPGDNLSDGSRTKIINRRQQSVGGQ